MEPNAQRQDGKASAKIKALEAQSGQESIFSYIMRHKPDLMAALVEAKSWADVHRTFLQHGLLIKASGNGLTIQDRYGKHQAKPSAIDRSLSKSQLAVRFGSFVEAGSSLIHSVEPVATYTAAPLQVGPERGQLYEVFQVEMARRKETLARINDDSAKSYAECRRRWDDKRQLTEKMPMLKHNRQRIRMELKKREQAELDKLRTETTAKRLAVREEIPYTSWNKCLQHKAAQGDETALAILRSKKVKVQPEQISQPPDKAPRQPQQNAKAMIVEAHGLTNKHRQALLAVVKMREVLASTDGQTVQDFKYTIDTKGTVIFRLADGGTIRDTGRQIHFSSRSGQAKDLAQKYAAARWGPALVSEGNVLQRSPDTTISRESNTTRIIQR